MELRFAVPGEAEALLGIYAEYIESSITFEYVLPGVAEFASRIAEYSREYPYLSLWDGERAVAYAYAHRAQERAAYGWNAELSIYISRGYTRRGIGRALYGALMELLTLQGVKMVYGVVTSPNPASFALHEALGFSRAAQFCAAGFKAGEWHDVVWFEKELAPHTGAPKPIRPVWEVAEREEILVRWEKMIG